MKYTIITTASQKIDDHIDRVNEHLSNGWKPQGGVYIDRVQQVFGGVIVYYHQALIKE